MKWLIIEIDHLKPICMFDLSKGEELGDAYNWKNTQPLLKEVHQQKVIKYKCLEYPLQFISAHQFIKLHEEGLNQDF